MASTTIKNRISVHASRAEFERAVESLVKEYRVQCLWFAPDDYFPTTDFMRMKTLDQIESHGDREAFIRARGLKDWLSQNSSER